MRQVGEERMATDLGDVFELLGNLMASVVR